MIASGMVVGMLTSEHRCGQHGAVPLNEGKGEVVRVDGAQRGDAVEGSKACGLDAECERDDVGDVCLGAVDLDGDAEEVYGLEALLVVKPLHEDADVVCNEWDHVLLEPTDDALECGSHIGDSEVGNATTNDEDLAVWAGHAACDEVGCMVVTGEQAGRVWTQLTDGLGILIQLPLLGHARILTVVGELVCEAMHGDGI